MNDWQSIWKRLSEGQHVVFEGTPTVPPPHPGLRLVVVECDTNPGPRGTLTEARRRVEAALQPPVPPPMIGAAPSHLRAELRRNLFGGPPERLDIEHYFRSFIAAPSMGGARVVLMLRGVDRADTESLELLTRLVRDGGPGLPLLLSFEGADRSPAAQRLFEALSRVLPPEAFRRAKEPERAADPEAASPGPLRSLPAATLRVLRAAATLGERFETEVLAELLQVAEVSVLEALQDAVDRGFPIEDRGTGVFRLEHGLAEALRATTLPSLARSWHERLAQLFGGLPAPSPPRATPPSGGDAPRLAVDETPGRPAAKSLEPGDRDGSIWLQRPDAEHEPEDPRREGWWQRLAAEAASQRAHEPGANGLRGAPEQRQSHGLESQLRAAKHAEAAGTWDLACERHVAAASIASRIGSHEAALEHVAEARRLAARVGDTELQRRAEMASRLVSGRAHWQSASSLDAAASDLRAARALMSDQDPPELRAELAMLLAGVQYDLGTRPALAQALQEVGLASRLLLDAGRPLDAARILNDEAAIWVKLGDPFRANHLLARSREVFTKLADVYPVARVELAETEHLLARLLLHATAKPGHAVDVLNLGVARGRAAEAIYKDLSDAQQLGRVWETLARLELRLGHVDAAARLLGDSQRLQLEIGDAIGLARSSAAASDVLVAAREYPRALELLSESIELNALKRLHAGLEFNLATLRQLEEQLPSELLGAARALERRARQALETNPPALA